MTDLSPRDLLALLSAADFTSAVSDSGDLTLTFGAWTIATREAGWRILDEATLVTGSADPNASATLRALTLGRITGLQPLSKFDLAFRCAPKWMIEFYALSPVTAEICTITGPGVHATYTVADSLVIARAN
ncbi:hypothetical protein sos41_33280 [Alphaproteobacteria bacterium SO-S41]|nr:hypothetical protein sos41_33280 [Alphaproteobacteria bacterium SO-S41]